MTKKITTQIVKCLEDWDVWEPPVNPDTLLHIPSMWELAIQAREINGGNNRIIVLELPSYYYVLVAHIGSDFALDVYISTDDEIYDELLEVIDSLGSDNVAEG